MSSRLALMLALSIGLAHCGPGGGTGDSGNPDGGSMDGTGGDGSNPPGDGTSMQPDDGPTTPIMGTWRVVNSGTPDDIYSLWGSGPSDVWAAAARSYLHTTNGTSWAVTMSDYVLRSVTGTGPNDVWMYGLTIPPNGSAETGHPVMFHKTTGATFAMSEPASLMNSQFYWMWARAPDDVWAVGTGMPSVARWDGHNWVGAMNGVDAADTLYGIYGFAANDIWLTGQHDYHWNGSTWARQMPPGMDMTDYSYGAWGATPNNVWIIGSHIYAQRWTGSGWAEADTHLDSNLNAIWGAAANDVWAVGDGGIIVHWNGRDWENGHAPTGQMNTLRAIWGSSASDIWAAGERGTLLHYTVP